jgi:DNA polymerase-1
VIKVAMVRIRDRLLRGRASRLVLQVHDELLLEVPEVRDEPRVPRPSSARRWCTLPRPAPSPSKIGVGDTWGDAKG